MANEETITYTCEVCGYRNIWTRDQIVQRGKREVYRDGTPEQYTLPCKNPNRHPACVGRRKVGLS
jgi:hypothetical protein